jgi:haloalkane dehalogenase
MVNAGQIPAWLFREYPFAPQSFLTPRGARLSYLDEGPRTDEAVVMLHGNPTWSYYFRHLVRALAPERRCIAPDHVGMGTSDKPPHYDYTLAARIDDVAALVDSLRLARVHLVLHDWGGAIGCGVAARRLETIGRLVIMNTAAFASRRLPRRIALCRLPVVGAWLVRGLNGFAWPATRMAMHRRTLSREESAGYLWPYDSWANRVALHAFVRDIPRGESHPSWATLQEIERHLGHLARCDTQIVWGGSDFCFNDHFLDRWRTIVPRARVTRIADAGHYVLEDARDEAVPLIRDFLLRA